MRLRSSLGALLLVGALAPLTSCSNDPSLTSIAVTPSSVTTSMTNGLKIYFTAIGSYTRPGHTAVTQDLTDQVTWSSSWPQFVVVDSSGVATVTGYGYGVGQIQAAAPGFHGVIVGTAAFTISQPTTTNSRGVQSLSLVPDGETASGVRFKARGVTADGETVELPAQPEWISTNNLVATIDKTSGVLSKIGPGRTTLTAVFTNPDGTTAVGKTSFTIQQ